MTNTLRLGLPPLTPRIAALPIDERGYPVPFFVAWVDGKPDHRIADPAKKALALRRHLCWVCGQLLGVHLAFAIGPMCTVNRLTSEPPAHRECAEWSVCACPFLSRPKAHRRETGLPDDVQDPGGIMLDRNPGVTAIWMTRRFEPFKADGGVLFRLDAPSEVSWYTEGRPATREEVLEALYRGLPALEEMAVAQGVEARAQLNKAVAAAQRWVPVT